MIISHYRGHLIYFNGLDWRYKGSHELLDHKRPCKRCGHSPTPEGYDFCQGFIPGFISVCCGHGEGPEIRVKEITYGILVCPD